MKVLFAVSDENISEAIVRKYQKNYKEIISYKNVYYFNAILKEIQKDKSYDRIVISEDLEPFANNNYEQIDKFIFDKLDSISDEATNTNSDDMPIILICTDRRAKSEEILAKLFSIGIYSAIIGNDRNIDEICKLIKAPRTKKEAKVYYKIDSDDAGYHPEDENGVSELEIQNILAHYKKLGKNEEKYVDSFNTIASQYTDEQLKIIINFLPLNVKAILEASSPKYQQIVTTMMGASGIGSQQSSQENEVKNALNVNYIESKKGRDGLAKPVVIPSTVNTKNVKKINSKKTTEPKFQNYDMDEYLDEINNASFDDILNDDEFVNPLNSMEQEKVEQPKRGRGRPKKGAEVKEIEQNEISQPKRGRGRPKKETIPEMEPVNLFDMAEENDEKETFEDIEFESPSSKKQVSNTMLPGFDDFDDFDDFDEEDNYQETNSIENYGSQSNQYSQPMQQPNQPYNINNYKRPETSTYMPNNSYVPNNIVRDMTNTNNEDYTLNNISNLLTRDKKLVAFLGTSKNGTSFLVNNVAESLSSSGINVAILDATKNRNAYYIYTKNEEELRQKAAKSIQKLISGMADGVKVNKNLTVYTSIPEEDVGMDNYEAILSTLVNNHSVVLIDCDFNTNFGYLASVQEIYLVQSMDVLTIQPLTAYLRDLKSKNVLDPEKIRIVINKETKVRNLSPKTIIGGMSFYNDPAMSFMTELFNRDKVKYCAIPFEEAVYSKYLEGLVNCKISLAGYSKNFMQALKTLENMVYPLIGSKTVGNYNKTFTNDMNNTLNQMKKKI